MSVRVTSAVVVGTPLPPALLAGVPHAERSAAISPIAAVARRGLAMADADASGWVEGAAGIQSGFDPIPHRSTLVGGLQVGRQRKVAVRIRIRPVGQPVCPHALRELDFHGDIRRRARVAGGSREAVVDRLAGLLRRVRWRLGTTREGGAALAVDGRVVEVGIAVGAGALDQFVPDLGRRFRLRLRWGSTRGEGDDRHRGQWDGGGMVQFHGAASVGRTRRKPITVAGDLLLTKSGDCKSPSRGRTAREKAPRITGEMRQGRRRWQERFGLQGKMAASYVLVTAAAVILVEGVAFGFILPNLLAGQDLISRVQQTAGDLAQQVALVSTATDHVALPADYVLGQPGIVLGPGQEQPSGNGVAVPQVGTSYPAGAPAMTLALAFTPDGTIIASTYPARYRVGSSAYAVIPTGAGYEIGARGQISPVANGRVAWSVQSVLLDELRSAGSGKPGTEKKFPPDALASVQASAQP